MNARCLGCHKEIAWLTAQNRGFHARGGRGECASCHPDHAGRSFALIKWPDGARDRFDHARAGWVLEDKHASLACEKCHTNELRVSQSAALAPTRSTPGWTGLETTCASCHTDVHNNSLGRECGSCHTASGWAPASRFDHARSDYPLTGKHADVACAQCHVPPARGANDGRPAVAAFKPLPHADCVACHRDPHAGRLTGRCESCHATGGFNTINGRAFSHDRTRFPLKGKHATVACAACHAGYPATMTLPAFSTCASCHADPHAGQATLVGAAVDCASCHTVDGFSPTTFTVAQHARTRYPLEGRHAAAACATCHTHVTAPASSGRGAAVRVVMRPVANHCESCHAAAHGDQLAARPDGGACASCHTVAGWTSTTFGVEEHSALRFPLTGRHATVACAACHAAQRPGLSPIAPSRSVGSANVVLTRTERSCDACHRDPHGGRYATTPAPEQGTCVRCHDTRAFHPSTIDADAHGSFAFALEGAHRAVACVACHTTMKSGALGASLKLAAASPAVTYTLPGATCAGCHASPHGAQFAGRADGGACTSCHELRGWAPASLFDHAANGGFALGPAHARVPCARCHTAPAGGNGAGRVWHGVSRACESCHRGGGVRP